MADRSFDPQAFIPAGLAFMLLLMGGIFGFMGKYETNKDAAMLTWPSTTGTVTSCGFVAYRDQTDNREKQHLVTSYAYTVDGKTHSFDVSEYAGVGNSAPSDDMLPHKANDIVPIYYNPDDPSDASIKRDRGVSGSLFYILFAGLAFLSLPLWYLAFRMAKRAPAASTTPSS